MCPYLIKFVSFVVDFSLIVAVWADFYLVFVCGVVLPVFVVICSSCRYSVLLLGCFLPFLFFFLLVLNLHLLVSQILFTYSCIFGICYSEQALSDL